MKAFLPSTIRLEVSSMDTDVKRKRGGGETLEDIEKRLAATTQANKEALEEIKTLGVATFQVKEDWMSYNFQKNMNAMIRFLEKLVNDYAELMRVASAPMKAITELWEKISEMVYDNINDEEAAAVEFIKKVRDFLVGFIESTAYKGDYTYIEPGGWDLGSGYKGKYGVFVETLELPEMRENGFVKDE